MSGYFRETTPADVEHIAANMRAADRQEVIAAHGHEDVLDILHQAVRASHLVWTGCAPDGEPVSILGVAPLNLLAGQGIPWMLATDAVDKYRRAMLMEGARQIAVMRRIYPQLENFVHAGNAKSVRWLKWLGFTVHPAEPFGARGDLFHRFSMGDN